MLPIEIRRIVDWPWPVCESCTRSAFKASYSDSLRLLHFEAGKLDASRIIVELDVTDAMIRTAGCLRASATPTAPRVVVTLETPGGWQRYPCDTYINWQHNMRAVALTLEHLRACDRYGVTKRGEQYTGFKALPPPGGAESNGHGLEDDYRFVFACAKIDWQPGWTGEDLARLVRLAKRNTHPDVGGHADDFVKVGRAEAALRKANWL